MNLPSTCVTPVSHVTSSRRGTLYIIQYAHGCHPCVFRAPIPLAEVFPPARPRSISGRGARGGSCPSGEPPIAAAPIQHVQRLSSHNTHHSLIQRVIVDLTCRVQRHLILEETETHCTIAAFSSKEQASSTHHGSCTNMASPSSSTTKDHNCLLLYVLLYNCCTLLGCLMGERVS